MSDSTNGSSPAVAPLRFAATAGRLPARCERHGGQGRTPGSASVTGPVSGSGTAGSSVRGSGFVGLCGSVVGGGSGSASSSSTLGDCGGLSVCGTAGRLGAPGPSVVGPDGPDPVSVPGCEPDSVRAPPRSVVSPARPPAVPEPLRQDVWCAPRRSPPVAA